MTPRVVALIDPLDTGHHSVYAALLAGEFVRRGLTVHVIGSAALVGYVLGRVPGARGHVLPLFPGSSAEYYALGRVARERLNLRFFRAAFGLAQAAGADTVHNLYLDSYFVPMLGAALLRPPARGMTRRATLHWAYFLRSFQARTALSEPGHLLMLRLLSWLGWRVMFHSPAVTAMLNARAGTPVVDTVPYPYEPPQFPEFGREEVRREMRAHLGLPQGDRVLLAFGGTRHDKGSDLAIRALPALPGHRLLVVGPTRRYDAEALRRQAREQGVEDRVHTVLEHVPDEDVERYFLASDIVLLPYRRNFSGQSGPLGIGAVLGIPVLASDVGVLTEMVNTYRLGALFSPEDPAALARTVLAFNPATFAPETARFRRDHTPGAFAEAVWHSYLHPVRGGKR